MKTKTYISIIREILNNLSRFTIADILEAHRMITVEEPCFGLSPKDKRTRKNLIVALERQIDWMVDFDHGVALVMNEKIDAEAAEAVRWKATDCDTVEMMEAVHAEALEINAQIDSELAKLCRVIAGVNRSEYKDGEKQEIISAACFGVLEGVRRKLEVKLDRNMLPGLVVRAGK